MLPLKSFLTTLLSRYLHLYPRQTEIEEAGEDFWFQSGADRFYPDWNVYAIPFAYQFV